MDANDRTLIYRAFDEELGPEDAARLRRLVRHSPEAHAEMETLREVRTLVAEHGAASFAPGFSARVMDRLATRSARAERSSARPSRARRRWMRAGWAAAALVLLIGIGWLLSRWPQTVHAPFGTTQDVTLPDGSQVELSAGSMLRYTPFWASNTRRVQLDGEAFFTVEADDAPFVVETFNARVVVKGTRFNVRAWAEDPVRETAVTLASGRVELVPRAEAAAALTLAAGETASVEDDSLHASTPVEIPLDRVLSWRSGGIAFVNRPLGAALRTVERRFDVRIQLDDAVQADRPLTYLNPNPRSADAVLSDICHVLDLRYQQTVDGYVVRPQ